VVDRDSLVVGQRTLNEDARLAIDVPTLMGPRQQKGP
jgi:hypothetical protein